ncbi:MAG TPA: hypothetical protein VLJ60_08395 [bacterium]|nr:hypothetical protein [bacterium]
MVKGKIVFLFLIIVLSAGCHNNKKALEIKEKPTEKPIETCYKTLYEQLEKEGSGYYTKYYVESFHKGERNPSLAFEISLERKRNDLAECFMKETADKMELTTMFASAIKYNYYNETLYLKLKSKEIDINAEVLIYGSSLHGIEDCENQLKLAPMFVYFNRVFGYAEYNKTIDGYYTLPLNSYINYNLKNEYGETPILVLLRAKKLFNHMIDSMIKEMREKDGQPKGMCYEKDYPDHSHRLTTSQLVFDEYIPIEGNKTTMYRFLYLPAFHNRVMVKIYISEDNKKIIEAKEADKHSSKIVQKVSRQISDDEWNLFMQYVEKAKYWDILTDSSMNEGILDGSFWFLEGFSEGKHHLVYRHSPVDIEKYKANSDLYPDISLEAKMEMSEYRKMCLYLIELSGIKLEMKSFY